MRTVPKAMATAAPEIPVLARDQAFESLYRRYVKDVYHYALALLRNPADAEDVTQTTFLNAYRAYARGVEVEKPQNWLIKIAHNVARTRYARASRRVKEVPLEDHVEQLAVPEENRPDVQGVLQALGRLPFNQRAALVMRELEGRTYAEIADTIGVSVSAVETLIFRARRSLRLKTSALRSLAAVPLPSSLAKLFEGGGVVAGGGGALAGAGFVIKAAVAIVAGVVATGISSDRGGRATAAGERALPAAAGQTWNLAPEWAVSAQQRTAKAAHAASGKGRAPFILTSGPLRHGAVEPAAVSTATELGVAAESGHGEAVASPLTTVTSQAQPVTDTTHSVTDTTHSVTNPAQPVTDTAKAAVAPVTAAVPAAVPLPQPPSLPPVPSVPVEVPKIPGGPPLP